MIPRLLTEKGIWNYDIYFKNTTFCDDKEDVEIINTISFDCSINNCDIISSFHSMIKISLHRTTYWNLYWNLIDVKTKWEIFPTFFGFLRKFELYWNSLNWSLNTPSNEWHTVKFLQNCSRVIKHYRPEFQSGLQMAYCTYSVLLVNT